MYCDDDKLAWLLNLEDPTHVVYAYRLDENEKPVKPYCLRDQASFDVLDRLSNEFGGGDFKLIIRKGRCMLFSGSLGIEPNNARYR